MSYSQELSTLGQDPLTSIVAGTIQSIPAIIKALTDKGPNFPQEYVIPISSLPVEYIPYAISKVMQASGAQGKRDAAVKAIKQVQAWAAEKYGKIAAEQKEAAAAKEAADRVLAIELEKIRAGATVGAAAVGTGKIPTWVWYGVGGAAALSIVVVAALAFRKK